MSWISFYKKDCVLSEIWSNCLPRSCLMLVAYNRTNILCLFCLVSKLFTLSNIIFGWIISDIKQNGMEYLLIKLLPLLIATNILINIKFFGYLITWNLRDKLSLQSCKLCNNKCMIAPTQITNTKIFAFRKFLFIKRKDNKNCYK